MSLRALLVHIGYVGPVVSLPIGVQWVPSPGPETLGARLRGALSLIWWAADPTRVPPRAPHERVGPRGSPR